MSVFYALNAIAPANSPLRDSKAAHAENRPRIMARRYAANARTLKP